MFSSYRHDLKAWLATAMLAMAGLWVSPAQAMSVTLTATPADHGCQGGIVRLAAHVTNQPAGTAVLTYLFTVNRTSDNSFEDAGFWAANPLRSWLPRADAAMRSPYNLWVIAAAYDSNNHFIESAWMSINGYQVQACGLSVELIPKPPTTVRLHCQVALYAVPTPHTPPSGQGYEYYFYVQDSNYLTVPGGCARSPNHLCMWRPAQLGTFRIGVQVYRVTLGNPASLENAFKEIAGYVVAPTGPCP